MTRIDIISGFLGAGKTTLIRKLLEGPLQGQNVVLIENEFGEIGIDSGFLKGAGIEIKEMNAGCICCTLVGDFSKALHDVLDRFSPDYIIIEPSGVGKLSDVAAAVQPVLCEGKVEMGCLTTVCDASKCRMYIKNFGEFYNNQLEHAGTIVLSRTQNLSQQRLDEALQLVRAHVGDQTSIITTPWDDLTGDQIYAVMCADGHQALLDAAELYQHEEHHHDHDGCCEHDHTHEHHHDHDGCCEHDHAHEHHHDHDGCCEHDHTHEHHHDHHTHTYDAHGVCTCGHHHDDHHADEMFTSWGMETAHSFTESDLRARLDLLSDTEQFGTVLRAKGIVPAADGQWLYFDMVPEEIALRRGAADYTGRLCVIGAHINEDALAALFS